MSMLPYNSVLGCIAQGHGKIFFPLQFPSTQHGATTTVRRNEVILQDVKTSCMFQNSFMLTVEKKWIPWPRLYFKEHAIIHESENDHQIKGSGREICRLNSNIDSSSTMAIVQLEALYCLVVCNIDGSVEVVRMIPKKQ